MYERHKGRGSIPRYAIAPLKEHHQSSTHLFMTTTRTRKRKVTTTMNELPKPLPRQIKTVQSHALDLTLISKDALFEDMRNRGKLHHYEVTEAMKDLKDMVTWTRNQFTNNKS